MILFSLPTKGQKGFQVVSDKQLSHTKRVSEEVGKRARLSRETVRKPINSVSEISREQISEPAKNNLRLSRGRGQKVHCCTIDIQPLNK